MRTSRVLVFLAFSAFSCVAAAAAPFCVVSGAGMNCMYTDYNYCWQMARSMHGACVVNQQPQTPANGGYVVGGMVTSSPADAFMKGQQHAMEMKRQQAEIDLLNAQREQLEEQQTGGQVLYRCGDLYTTRPKEGCVVAGSVPVP